MWLVLDIGNSAVKGGFFEGDQLKHPFRISWPGEDAPASLETAFEEQLRGRSVTRAGIASVVPEATPRVQALLDRLAKIEAEARNKSSEKAVETLEQVNGRHLRIARSLQAKALEAMRDLSLDDAKDVIRALDLGVKQERLILGEPSERHAISVQETIEREYERWMVSKETISEVAR